MGKAGAVPRKNPSTAGRTIDGQAVITVADDAHVSILNDVGTRVWNLVDGKRSVEGIIADVRGQLEREGYESLPADLAADVEEFLLDMSRRGMLSLEGREG